MGFSAMDGFFLAVFLAVCILAAVILRCICYRCCLNSCSQKFRQANTGEMILPRHTTPTITPARPQPYAQVSVVDGVPVSSSPRGAPPPSPRSSSRAVFTIYTFPQSESPDLIDRSPPRTPGPPKYSSLPVDAPPKYEDLFPQADFSLPAKTPSPDPSPLPRGTSPSSGHPPPSARYPAPKVPTSTPPPEGVPPEDPPTYTPDYPPRTEE